MRWEDERYVRVYTRDTPEWCLLSWEARALFLLLLTAVGPLLAWRRTSLESLKRNFFWPAAGALIVAAALIAGNQQILDDILAKAAAGQPK